MRERDRPRIEKQGRTVRIGTFRDGETRLKF
jgi:hypothetical protein